jgi:4-hydroxythreonine-4-phosphate dehydrogenase
MTPLALSIGDPSGIGPEIAAKAWLAREIKNLPPFFVVGDHRAISAVWRGPIVSIENPEETAAVFQRALPVLAVENQGEILVGHPSLEGAGHALQALEIGVGLARSGAASGLVTGPVSKAQLYAVGFRHPGQTEFIAERCGVSQENTVMMLVARTFRVVPVTIHIALSQVAQSLTTELIVARARAAVRGLIRDFGISAPRIAVAGLNPHAGEGGTMGDEEGRVIAPAIESLKAEGINAFGPISPDSLFTAAARDTYDLALCMYHDQALIPLKALYFDEGVNMTLGLPIIRTSPDHGTAFAIAGQGKADPGAMIAAIQAAASATHFRALQP